MRSIIAFAMLVVCATLAAGAEPDVCKRIRQHYHADASIRAEFEQSIYWSVREKTSKSRGMFVCAPGNRFRVETGNETYVSDGSVCWQYSRANNQVVIRSLGQFDPSTLPSRLLSGALSEYRFVETGRGGGVVTLASRADSAASPAFKTVKVDVRDSDGMVSMLEVTDRNDNVQTFRFKKTVFNKPAEAATFTFEAPPDANVIDHRN